MLTQLEARTENDGWERQSAHSHKRPAGLTPLGVWGLRNEILHRTDDAKHAERQQGDATETGEHSHQPVPPEKDANEHLGEDTHERTLTVDGEETTLIVMDTWETEKQSFQRTVPCHMEELLFISPSQEEDEKWVQDYCMQVGNAYVIVYSITDRSSFESASELRIQLRRIRQAENIPIILVGNKSDLVRCREVAVEEGRACAVVFDCKFIETSASLHHNVDELFEGIVRQIRLRRDSKETNERRRSVYKRQESVAKKARRFLDRLVAKNNKKMALKVRSKSCHDLSVL
ncbi:hypothetical protein ANANG_G00253510 [Anguilla anguilla]|uniref:GTP-binding protein REM 2 n=1 Tax=Anguilla anguilla TaxID=7936 RepID=A0A9D3RMW0_ANGAN|nr:hypothetical protein ANANG_G00253510 [Anguilla anguilla]